MNNPALRAILTVALWFIALGAIGIIAYQGGEFHRLAFTLEGIDADSRFGIVWKAALGAIFLAWWFDRLKQRKTR